MTQAVLGLAGKTKHLVGDDLILTQRAPNFKAEFGLNIFVFEPNWD